MDQFTPHKSARPPVVDQPEPGVWKLRLYPGGWHEVPCRIDHQDGLWSAELDGAPAGLPHRDPIHADGVLTVWHKRKVAISEAEYAFLTGKLKDWAREFYPDHPLLAPARKVRVAGLRPIPQFTPPLAPAALAPEPLPENKPTPPAPPAPEQIAAWLEYNQEALAAAIARDTKQLRADAKVTVDDDASLARVAANVDIARAHMRQLKAAHATEKAPFLAGGRTVDGWHNRLRDSLETAIAPVQAAMDGYGARLERERREEAERQAAAARAEADRLASREQRQGTGAAATVLLDEAQAAAKTADQAESVAGGRAADLTRSFTAYGKTVSGRESYDFAVEDISKVPLQYLQINETLIRQTVREYARNHPESARAGVSPIAGIRIIRAIAMR